MSKYFLYAVIVTLTTSGASWVRAVSGDRDDRSSYRGSTWSSFGSGGGSYGNGSGGGGHK
jgi:hypothetical protein